MSSVGVEMKVLEPPNHNKLYPIRLYLHSLLNKDLSLQDSGKLLSLSCLLSDRTCTKEEHSRDTLPPIIRNKVPTLVTPCLLNSLN